MNEKIKKVYEKIKTFSKSDDFMGFECELKESLKLKENEKL